MKRFSGAIVALAGLLLVVLAYVLLAPSAETEQDLTPEIFKFEESQLSGIKVERPESTIELIKHDGEWSVVGHPWRPSRSMVRRVAHQLHDLTARAVVAEGLQDVAEYGLGEGSIKVTLSLEGREPIIFEAGDPNPTSVSWYVRPVPGDQVFIVKKSAIDYYRLSLEHFREKRVGIVDASEAERIEAVVDGRRIVVRKVRERTWEMTEPVVQRADRQLVRTMLGRTGALKAMEFVADAPKDLAQWKLAEPAHRVQITLSGDRTVTLRVAEPFLEEDQSRVYVYREEDDSVYKVKGGFLDAFREDAEKYRDTLILGSQDWDLKDITVSRGEDSILVKNSSGGWRWDDETPISGSTPRRLASESTDLRALEFHDDGTKNSGLETPSGRVVFHHNEKKIEILLGSRFEVTAGAQGRTEKRTHVQIKGEKVSYVITGGLSDIIDDLFREHGRKLERDAEKHLGQQGEDHEK